LLLNPIANQESATKAVNKTRPAALVGWTVSPATNVAQPRQKNTG
jgi:hypothetical protein